ncbi:hypothetical protein YC2023_121448 [Brassica napus]
MWSAPPPPLSFNNDDGLLLILHSPATEMKEEEITDEDHPLSLGRPASGIHTSRRLYNFKITVLVWNTSSSSKSGALESGIRVHGYVLDNGSKGVQKLKGSFKMWRKEDYSCRR